MKVLTFLTNIDQDKGGPSRSVPLFVRGLAEIGVEITLMVIKSNDMNLHTLDGTSAKVHLLPSNYKKSELEDLILREKYDVIHGQCIWEPLFHQMRVLADKYHIPYILTPRGTLEPWSLQQKKWKKRIARWLYQDKDLKRCACIYTTATMEADHIRELGFKNPICIISNGLEISNYPCRKDFSSVKKQILFLSRIHPKKGVEVLLDAWQMIKEKYKNWNIIIAGNGEQDYVNKLEQKVALMGLSDTVKIIPPVFGDDKYELYSTSSLFVLPSYSENFGMAIAEALSCGVPVITTKNTPWEILNETSTGWCVELNVENIKTTLDEALGLSDIELFKKGQKGSVVIRENFDYKSVAMMNKQLYEWILNGGRIPPFVDSLG